MKQEGLRQGLLKAIQLGLKLKFGAAASGLMDAIQKIPDVTRLDEILEAIESASQVSDIRKKFCNRRLPDYRRCVSNFHVWLLFKAIDANPGNGWPEHFTCQHPTLSIRPCLKNQSITQ